MRASLLCVFAFVFPASAVAQLGAETPAPEPPPSPGQSAPEDVSSQSEETKPKAPAPASAPSSGTEGSATRQVDVPAAAPAVPGFRLEWDGYLRVMAATFTPNRFFGIVMPSSFKRDSLPTVGRNDGFSLAGARLNLRAVYRDLYVRLGFDGAIVSFDDDLRDPVGELSTGLKDAYIGYAFGSRARLYVGRFKPPYDVEELRPTESLFFATRSLESRGVLPHEGPHTDLFGRTDVSGFAPGRQIGLMLTSDRLVDLGGSRLGYALAVTNGSSGDESLNDNDLPAVYGRMSFGWDGTAAKMDDEEGPATYNPRGGGVAGLSAFYNELTTGVVPNRFRDRVFGAGADISFDLLVFNFQGQVLAARVQPLTRRDVPASYAFGGHAQVAVQVLDTGFFPAYRFAVLDPRYVPDDGESPDQDRVIHHTIGLTYRALSYPIVSHLEYTRSVEQAGRSIPNDRVQAAVQVTF